MKTLCISQDTLARLFVLLKDNGKVPNELLQETFVHHDVKTAVQALGIYGIRFHDKAGNQDAVSVSGL